MKLNTLLQRSLLALLLLFIFSENSFAQRTQISFDRNFDIKIFRNGSSNFEGTPFLFEDWRAGNVIFSDGTESENEMLKYSSYSNELLFKQNGTMLAVTPSSFKGFQLRKGGQQLIFMKGFQSADADISTNTILEVIYNGNVKLVVKHEKEIYERNSDPLSGEKTKSFQERSNNYLVDLNGNYHDIDLDEGDILEALGSHQEALKNFADQNDLSFENKADLAVILTRYDAMAAEAESSKM